MNVAAIKFNDIANGPGVRTSLFVSGCTHRCPGCFNAVAWDFDYGQPFTEKTEETIIGSMTPFVRGLTLLGGEPMEPQNQAELLLFLHRFRERCPDKTVWCYSGYRWEQLTGEEAAKCRTGDTDDLLAQLDVLVDGPFVQALHDVTLRFRGSANQRLIDVPASLRSGSVRIWQDDPMFSSHELPC